MENRDFAPDKDKPLDLVQLLKERLERYQAQCNKLREQNKDIAVKIRALHEDTPDMQELLQQQEIEDKNSEWMEERLQVQADRKATEDLELLISQERKELQEEELVLVERMQAARLEAQKQQLVSLEQQILKNKPLKEELMQRKVQFSSTVHTLEEQKKFMEEKMVTIESSIQQMAKPRPGDLDLLLRPSAAVKLPRIKQKWKD